MSALNRTDTSLLGKWWWTVDRWTLAAVALLLAFGGMMALAASPAVAERIGVDPFHFVKRQAVFLCLGALTIIGVSLLSPKGVRRLGILVTLGAILLMIMTILVGVEIKGASRWLNMAGFSLQPSEFVKSQTESNITSEYSCLNKLSRLPEISVSGSARQFSPSTLPENQRSFQHWYG